jgi:(4S)-4-hydroxy-5-phosphonooxypentane-2,3-dione isomerase
MSRRVGDDRNDMHIVHVHIQIKAGSEDAFVAATLENARNSVREPGIARFDVIRDTTDRTKFVFVEVYRDTDAAVRHKETSHYAVWRDTVADMMAVPRVGTKYENVYPAEGGW